MRSRRPRLTPATRDRLAKHLNATARHSNDVNNGCGAIEVEVARSDDIRPRRLYQKSNGEKSGEKEEGDVEQLSRSHRKKLNERDNWLRLMEKLVTPYLELLRTTSALRSEPPMQVHNCGCRTRVPFKIFRIDFKSKPTLALRMRQSMLMCLLAKVVELCNCIIASALLRQYLFFNAGYFHARLCSRGQLTIWMCLTLLWDCSVDRVLTGQRSWRHYWKNYIIRLTKRYLLLVITFYVLCHMKLTVA